MPLSLKKAANFKATYENREEAITSKLDCRRKEMEGVRRAGVNSIVKCVLFLGKQGQPFRGHRNEEFAHQDFGLYNQDNISSLNSGMFLELIKLMCSKDASLKMHIEKAPRNEKYISKHSQN